MDDVGRTKDLGLNCGDKLADKYELVSATNPSGTALTPLGQGGTGIVFRARQHLSPKAVVFRAVKFYLQSEEFGVHGRSSRKVSASNFDNEIVNLSGFNHQNILKVIEAGIWTSPAGAEIPFLVTDFLEGPSLQQAMEDRDFQRRIHSDPDILIQLIQHLCRGVSHLHSKNFYHCDIAPKNIFLQQAEPGYQLVIGDLGTGRTIPSLSSDLEDTVFVVGTAEYCPPEVQQVLNHEIPLEQFQQYQPRWDLFAVAKTCLKLLSLRKENEQSSPSWLRALRSSMAAIVDRHPGHCETIDELQLRVDLLNPIHHSIWQVDELSASGPRTRRELLPIEQVPTSIRTRAIIRHPALVRLKRVPQIMMGSKTLYSGKHDRYEHSLGVFQTARRYLIALLNDHNFLNFFSPKYIEFALVTALLSNITRYPFSNIIGGLRSRDRKLFTSFSTASIFDELIDQFGNEPSLRATIEQHFPLIEITKLRDVLTGIQVANHEPQIHFIRALFNSSIDVRVMDYLRRDSHHVGIFQGDVIDLGDILPHLRFRENEVVVQLAGLPVLEQIITLRYWLYSRVYWNRPNRSLIAMLRWVFISLQSLSGFDNEFRKHVLVDTEDKLLELCSTTARNAGRQDIAELCGFLAEERPNLFKEILQFNRAEGDAHARKLCDSYESASLLAASNLQADLNKMLIGTRSLPADRIHVLLDLPMVFGSMKLGEDLNIENHSGELLAASKLSGVIEGAQRGFSDHIRRLRVFLHPNTYTKLSPVLPAVIRDVREFLVRKS